MKKILLWTLLIVAVSAFFALAAKSMTIKDPQIKAYVDEYAFFVEKYSRELSQADGVPAQKAVLAEYSKGLSEIIAKWNANSVSANSDDFRKAQNKINSLNQKMMSVINGLFPKEKTAP